MSKNIKILEFEFFFNSQYINPNSTKDIQATGEAYSHQKRTFRTSKHCPYITFSSFVGIFCHLWMWIHTDPQHWFFILVLFPVPFNSVKTVIRILTIDGKLGKTFDKLNLRNHASATTSCRFSFWFVIPKILSSSMVMHSRGFCTAVGSPGSGGGGGYLCNTGT
jgi:hypothetical protein